MTLADTDMTPATRLNGAASAMALLAPPSGAGDAAPPDADDRHAPERAPATADARATDEAAKDEAAKDERAKGSGAVAAGGRRIGPSRLAPRDMPAVKAEARRLIEGTTLSAYEIARRLDIADSTVCTWKKAGGWVRPEGAPVQPHFGGHAPVKREPRDRHADMVTRLYRVFDRQTADLEARAAQPGATTDEKDARTLSVLARTLDILKALDRDDGAKTDAPEPADRERFNAELARRIRRWAEGRTGA